MLSLRGMDTHVTCSRPSPSPSARTAALPVCKVRLVSISQIRNRDRSKTQMSLGISRNVSHVLCKAGLSVPAEEASQKGEKATSFSVNMRVPNVTMAGGKNFGSGGSLGAVMEKSKLQFIMPTPTPEKPRLDDGGSGGDIGKRNHNGGGGDGDGGDDDDYGFGEDGDGDGEGERATDAFFRTVVPESYDKLSIGAVFQEWLRTVSDLPMILRRAVEMGLFSSAQLVRFFSMDVRPNVTRTISRKLPPTWARDFVGRMMADPAFVQKLMLETVLASGFSLAHELRARGKNATNEADLVAINTLGLAAATAASVWALAPSRSYGALHKFPWQAMLEGLPSHVFDAAGPLRQYNKTARLGALVARAAELSAIGAIMGSATAALSAVAVSVRRQRDPTFEPSVPVPGIGRSSAGMAAYFAVNANMRYQLLGGLDRYLFDHTNFLWTYLGASIAARVGGTAFGECSRPWWQGITDRPAVASSRVQRQQRLTEPVLPVVSAVVSASPEAEEAGQQLLPSSFSAVSVSAEESPAVQPVELHLTGARAEGMDGGNLVLDIVHSQVPVEERPQFISEQLVAARA